MTTNDGHQLSHLIPDFKPDIILIDVIMGILDGVELCRQLKGKPNFAHITVILMTAGLLREKDKHSGADGYIEKPFDIQATFALIESLTLK